MVIAHDRTEIRKGLRRADTKGAKRGSRVTGNYSDIRYKRRRLAVLILKVFIDGFTNQLLLVFYVVGPHLELARDLLGD